MNLSFTLEKSFVDRYRERPEPFGFGAVGPLTFYRTYARPYDENRLESWAETTERVINGMYSIQKEYAIANGVPWSDEKAKISSHEAYDRLFNLKWSPPGRGLFHMGAASIHERGLYEALQNCAFISTSGIKEYNGAILEWIMSMLMLGVGVGTDLKGSNAYIYGPTHDSQYTYVIPDSREGWAKALRRLFDSYVVPDSSSVYFDYSLIRKKGEPIRGFGGVSSGPDPLIWLLDKTRSILDGRVHNQIGVTALADIINSIGCTVVAGNVRRSSEILLGNPNDLEFLNLKNYNANPGRAEIGWASNNSVFGEIGMSYKKHAEGILSNGEPGIVWLENANMYGRMNGQIDMRDRGTGFNPCGEQVLEGYSSAGVGGELCTLVDVYPYRHSDKYDFYRSLKFAFLYGKSITLLSDMMSYPGTKEIMSRNRRIGLSLTGIVQFTSKFGLDEARKWFDVGYDYVRHYDKRYSAWFNVPESNRVTSVKPSGTVGLLSGSTPGVHFPHSQYYIRRVRLADNSPLVYHLQNAGVNVEPDKVSRNTLVAEMPVFVGENLRVAKKVSMFEQLALASFMQKHWSDNSVSVTISVDTKKYDASDIEAALNLYQYQLKSVSMLPETETGAYEQMPYEEIDKERFAKMNSVIDYSKLKNMNQTNLAGGDKMQDSFCDGEACVVQF